MVKTVISPMPPVKIIVILAKTEISQKKKEISRLESLCLTHISDDVCRNKTVLMLMLSRVLALCSLFTNIFSSL